MLADKIHYRYWGKAGIKNEAKGAAYHLLPYHCMDVAAVGFLLLDPEKPLCRALAADLDIAPDWLQQWFTFCLMLHDVGKFARCFQNKVTGLSPELVQEKVGLKDVRHDSLGFALWQLYLSEKLVAERKLQRATHCWMGLVCGHHGKPPQTVEQGELHTTLVQEEDIPAAKSFLRELKEWLPSDLAPLQKFTGTHKKRFKNLSWQLAGLAVLADWLGSDQTFFEYKSEILPLQNYWEEVAKKKAGMALKEREFLPRSVNDFVSIKQQFTFIERPTPLQDLTQKVEICDSPQLFILEDVTGAGKTEAAMVLVHRLLSQGLAEGLYVGLPTMATANAMYERLKDSYQSLFRGPLKPSLVLAHGSSQLSQSFQETVRLAEQDTDHDYAADDKSASAYCNQWLADSRKKALLADIGVGTIDQALLAVLPARHQSLRMLGLRNKVLLVDEVHAYDPYMRTLLVTLLKAHAAQRGSVVLLSATLPQKSRQELLNAYREGRGQDKIELQTQAYPLATQLSDNALIEKSLPTRDCVKRQLTIKRVNDESAAIDVIVREVERGGCICWVRNTVKDARLAWQQLADDSRISPEKLSLFHSRFAMIDRQSIENDVLKRFGKKSEAPQRTGQVLIATQVVEQSLDLDFDVLITDLAPMDLLIQRAGRLRRHNRDACGNRLDNDQPDQRPPPCLFIHSPDPERVHDDQWLSSALPGTQSVYSHVGQLWLTAKLLFQKKGFSMPEDARDLIEGVYGDDAQATIPEVLEELSDDALAGDKAKRSMGNFNCLELGSGYTWNSGSSWGEEARIPTRLNEQETVTVALAVPDVDESLEPLSHRGNPKQRWQLSQLQVPAREWKKAQDMIPRQWSSLLERLKLQFSYLKYSDILPLVAETKHLYTSESGWDIDRKPET